MNASNANVFAIILAAGSSSRLGSPKQLLAWRNASLLEHAVSNARTVLYQCVIVVLGAHADAIHSAVDLDGLTVVVNPDWQEGMASSIRAGVRALPASASAALILLCDQPLVNASHLRKLLEAWEAEPNHIVASEYRQSVGVPALFPAEFFDELSALNGDRGAKLLLLKFDDRLLKIPLPEAELDIDNAEDVARLAVSDDVR